jgi:hypothetical protein
VIAERIAKDCLILPSSGVDLNTMAALADTAIQGSSDHSAQDWFGLVKGLAEYRLGRFASAGEWAQKALSHPVEALHPDIECSLLLAMAQHRLGSASDGTSSLAKAIDTAETKLVATDNDLGSGWINWVFSQALLQEAKGLKETRP